MGNIKDELIEMAGRDDMSDLMELSLSDTDDTYARLEIKTINRRLESQEDKIDELEDELRQQRRNLENIKRDIMIGVGIDGL